MQGWTLNSRVPSCCRPPLFLGNDPTQDFTLTPNVIWGTKLGLFCHGPWGFVYLSIHTLLVFCCCLSHLCLNSFLHSFVSMIWKYAYGPLFKYTQCLFVCYLLHVSTSLFSFDALEYAFCPLFKCTQCYIEI